MKIDKRKCVGCELCHPYCPVGAITAIEWEGKSVSEIDQRECVECGGACLVRARVCPEDAIYMPQLEWPRSIRAFFSDPLVRRAVNNDKAAHERRLSGQMHAVFVVKEHFLMVWGQLKKVFILFLRSYEHMPIMTA